MRSGDFLKEDSVNYLLNKYGRLPIPQNCPELPREYPNRLTHVLCVELCGNDNCELHKRYLEGLMYEKL